MCIVSNDLLMDFFSSIVKLTAKGKRYIVDNMLSGTAASPVHLDEQEDVQTTSIVSQKDNNNKKNINNNNYIPSSPVATSPVLAQRSPARKVLFVVVKVFDVVMIVLGTK